MSAAASDHAVAASVAGEVGAVALAVRAAARARGAPAGQVRAEGDRRAHEAAVAALHRARPGDAVLSEEGDLADLGRLAAARVWLVDPLDGTREYGEPGRGDWAVHVALWEAGGLAAGAVALPAEGLCLSTADPPPPPPVPGRAPVLVVSRTRRSAGVDALAAAVGAVVVPMGSCGAKAMAVVRGSADAYAHAGGLKEWDVAAPAAVAAAAGLHVSHLDGRPLAFNRHPPLVGDLLVCRRELAPRLLAAWPAP